MKGGGIHTHNETYSNVIKFEQERLFNTTAVLYYGLNEIQNLEQQGQMFNTPFNVMHSPRLKSGGEPSGGSRFGDSCKAFLGAGWVIALAEPTPVGEGVMILASAIVGGILVYKYITCTTTHTRADCIEKFEDCRKYTHWYDCDMCLHRCRSSGIWKCPTN